MIRKSSKYTYKNARNYFRFTVAGWCSGLSHGRSGFIFLAGARHVHVIFSGFFSEGGSPLAEDDRRGGGGGRHFLGPICGTFFRSKSRC